MIDAFLRGLESAFAWMLEASWQASVLAALVLLLQGVLRDKLNPRWRHALWLLVIARLLLPVLPESALSLFQFAPPPPPAVAQTITEPIFSVPPLPVVTTETTPAPPPSYPFSTFTILALVWLAGALGLFLATWLVNRRFARHVLTAPAVTDPHLLQLIDAARHELGLRFTLRAIESAQIQSPAIMGLLRPTLILPHELRARFTDDELRFIFLHEFAHLKRGDLLLQWLIALLQVVHWFNPVLWYAFRRMRIDREPATDALVLSRTGEAHKESYGHVLVKLLEHYHNRHALPTLVGILEDKDQFKQRFILITKFTRGAYGWSLLGVLCLVVLSTLCLTAKTTASINSGKVATMSADEAAAKGIGALVNGQPIYWDAVAPGQEPQIGILLSKYRGEALNQNLAQERYFRRDQQIDRELILECAQREGYQMPQGLLDEKINFGVNGYHGDKAAFVENLRKNGQTLEQFNEFNRDTDVFYHETMIHREPLVDQFVREHYPQADFEKQQPTNEQENAINDERTRIQNKWMNTLRSGAVIQLFDDPQNPGAKPPDFVSKMATQIAPPSQPTKNSSTYTKQFISTPELDGATVSGGQKPAVKIHITFIELNQKDHEQQAQTMDEAVRTGDLSFFHDQITRATNLILMTGQNGWYSEGEVWSYVSSAKREKKDGEFHTVLNSKAIFLGLNADFSWSKDKSSMTSTWSVTAPVGFDPLPLGPDIPRDDIPRSIKPLLVPRVTSSRYEDKAWDMAPNKAHGFWVSDPLGYRKLSATPGSPEEKIKLETPSKLAVFLTAEPYTAPETKTTAAPNHSPNETATAIPPPQQKLPWPVPATVNPIGYLLSDSGEVNQPTDPAINNTIDRLTIHQLDAVNMPLQDFMNLIAKQLKQEHPDQPLWSTELMSPDTPFLVTFHLQQPASVRQILQQLSVSYPLRFQFRGAPNDFVVWQSGDYERAFAQKALATTIQLSVGQADVKTALLAIEKASAAQGFDFDLKGIDRIGNKFGTTVNAPITLPTGPITVDQALRRILTAGNLRLIAQEHSIFVSPLQGGFPMKDADFAAASGATVNPQSIKAADPTVQFNLQLLQFKLDPKEPDRAAKAIRQLRSEEFSKMDVPGFVELVILPNSVWHASDFAQIAGSAPKNLHSASGFKVGAVDVGESFKLTGVDATHVQIAATFYPSDAKGTSFGTLSGTWTQSLNSDAVMLLTKDAQPMIFRQPDGTDIGCVAVLVIRSGEQKFMSSTDKIKDVQLDVNPEPAKPDSPSIAAWELSNAAPYFDNGTRVPSSSDLDALDFSQQLINRRNHLVKLMWEHGKRECSPLTYAITQGMPPSQIVQMLKEGVPAAPPQQLGVTALGAAVVNGNLPVVQLLVEHGALPNQDARAKDAYNPLLLAVNGGHLEIVAYLLDHGVQADPHSMFGAIQGVSLYLPADKRAVSRQMVDLLATHGGLDQTPSDLQRPMLHIACLEVQDLDLTKLLLVHGFQPGELGPDGKTPIIEEVRQTLAGSNNNASGPHLKSILNLLETANAHAGSDAIPPAKLPPSLTEAEMKAVEDSQTPLMKAFHKRKYDEARKLLTQGADVDAQDKRGNTALTFLIDDSGNSMPFPIDILKIVLQRAHDPNPRIYSEFSTPPYSDPTLDVSLMAASVTNEPARLAETRQIVQLLLEHGAKFQGASGDVRALLEAATRGDLVRMQQLVANGTSIDSVDANGWSPLLVSIALDYDVAANWLVDHGANVNVPTTRGAEDPLTYAAFHGRDDLVEKLIARGAKPDLAWRGLQRAVDKNDQRLFDDLIKAGADPKSFARAYGGSGGKEWRQIISEPLYTCIENGQTAMALTILDKGVDPEPADVDNNQNYAYWAVHYDRPQILQSLLDHGANPELKDDNGETPFSLAQKSHPDLVPMLQAAMTKFHGTTMTPPPSPTPSSPSLAVKPEIQQHIDHEMADLTKRLQLTSQQAVMVRAAMEAVVNRTATKSVDQVIREIGNAQQVAAWEQTIKTEQVQRASALAVFESKRIAVLLGLNSAQENEIDAALDPVELHSVIARDSAHSAADYFAVDSLEAQERDTALAKILKPAQLAILRADRERQAAAAEFNLSAPIFQVKNFNPVVNRPANASLPAFTLTGR